MTIDWLDTDDPAAECADEPAFWDDQWRCPDCGHPLAQSFDKCPREPHPEGEWPLSADPPSWAELEDEAALYGEGWELP